MKKDNTISYKGRVYQLLPSEDRLSYADRMVEVLELLDRRLVIVYNGKEVKYSELGKKASTGSEREREEEILSKRRYMIDDRVRGKHKPGPDHPWRKSFRIKNKR